MPPRCPSRVHIARSCAHYWLQARLPTGIPPVIPQKIDAYQALPAGLTGPTGPSIAHLYCPDECVMVQERLDPDFFMDLVFEIPGLVMLPALDTLYLECTASRFLSWSLIPLSYPHPCHPGVAIRIRTRKIGMMASLCKPCVSSGVATWIVGPSQSWKGAHLNWSSMSCTLSVLWNAL